MAVVELSKSSIEFWVAGLLWHRNANMWENVSSCRSIVGLAENHLDVMAPTWFTQLRKMEVS